ncbi:MAG TPA: methylmalonyl-CoA mutase family protein [Bacteroidales bacterium]|nr:methylmalonyl-CoA mutase family protein [Bacteroidales bacterium]
MEESQLFKEFPPISVEEWEKVIIADLKGADYDKKLIWKTIEGINVKPYYTAADTSGLAQKNAIPGTFPYIRGNKPNHNLWEICQDIKVYDVKTANSLALEAVERGATAINFIFCKEEITSEKWQTLTKDIKIGCICFSVKACSQIETLYQLIVDDAAKNGYDINLMHGALQYDPVGMLLTKGAWVKSEKEDMAVAANLIEKAKTQLPKYKVITVNGALLQESGATIVQEMAYSLAIANEYISKITAISKFSAEDVIASIRFNMATSSNYFFEIAKIRAFRLLWAKVAEAWTGNIDKAKAYIHCKTLQRNMTAFDPYVNMLRATTECMSAVIGGADSVSVRSFDEIYKKADSFSNRIARNVQIILKEEAYLGNVADPAAGSYYVESITSSLATEAWKLFQQIESEGGFLEAVKKGTIQSAIEAVAQKRLANISSRRETLLGTNQYPNFTEQQLANIDAEIYDEKQILSSSPVVKPLIRFREANEIENLRLTTERSGKRPKVFMLTIGNLAMRLARSQFSCNFFAVGGFEVIDNNGFKTVAEGVEAAQKAKADIIVLCSSDDEYATFGAEAIEAVGSKAILVIAGAPACMDELKAKGAKNFISVKSNVLDTLKEYQKMLNI